MTTPRVEPKVAPPQTKPAPDKLTPGKLCPDQQDDLGETVKKYV